MRKTLIIGSSLQLLFFSLLGRYCESISITPSDEWTNSISNDNQEFVKSDYASKMKWAKFTMLVSDLSVVYYQKPGTYEFHVDFIAAYLDPYKGMSRAEIDAKSLFQNGQELILGAVLWPDSASSVNEFGVQLVRRDAYDREMVRQVLQVVYDSIQPKNEPAMFYFPTFEQEMAAQAERAFFLEMGMPVSSVLRWSSGSSICYSPGWAFGRLLKFDASEIDDAYADGQLTYRDVVLIDGVPAEIPRVAGVVSLSPATPNSHVALLATSYGIPFGYLSNSTDVQSLVGDEILFRVDTTACDVFIRSVVGVDESLRAAILEKKVPRSVQLTPMAHASQFYSSVSTLNPNDIEYFGGKAANFGLLTREIPGYSPTAYAFSFNLWLDFMSRIRPNISAFLDNHAWPPNVAQVKDDLKSVRKIIKSHNFIANEIQAIENALATFPNSSRKIRFRSSTNVEDTESFIGAGLYDSYSGCLLDDQDGDDVGPSLCDPAKSKERGVQRALRKVFASFYNDNAFLERLRYGVNESEVGMAVLVHYSFPDPHELANGVAVMTRTVSSSGYVSNQLSLVTQLGATSVTNPEIGTWPEEVEGGFYSFGFYAEVKKRSSLTRLGAEVMVFEDDYKNLAALLINVTQKYVEENALTNADVTLDFEYKKMQEDGVYNGLVVKQVRRVPAVVDDGIGMEFLVNEASPVTTCVFQGEFGEIMSNHRSKSILALRADSITLDNSGLDQSLWQNIDATVIENGALKLMSGAPSSWSGSSHDVTSYDDPITVKDSWQDSGRKTSLSLTFSRAYMPTVVTASDLMKNAKLEMDYDIPVPQLKCDSQGKWTMETTRKDIVKLEKCPSDKGAKPRQSNPVSYNISVGQKQRVEIEYYRPVYDGSGFSAGYTAPLHSWAQTRFVGFAERDIVLRGYFSQTFLPLHHNFWENFLFEPQLEEGLDACLIQQLESANIRYIFVGLSSHFSNAQLVPSNFVVGSINPAGEFQEAGNEGFTILHNPACPEPTSTTRDSLSTTIGDKLSTTDILMSTTTGHTAMPAPTTMPASTITTTIAMPASTTTTMPMSTMPTSTTTAMPSSTMPTSTKLTTTSMPLHSTTTAESTVVLVPTVVALNDITSFDSGAFAEAMRAASNSKEAVVTQIVYKIEVNYAVVGDASEDEIRAAIATAHDVPESRVTVILTPRSSSRRLQNSPSSTVDAKATIATSSSNEASDIHQKSKEVHKSGGGMLMQAFNDAGVQAAATPTAAPKATAEFNLEVTTDAGTDYTPPTPNVLEQVGNQLGLGNVAVGGPIVMRGATTTSTIAPTDAVTTTIVRADTVTTSTAEDVLSGATTLKLADVSGLAAGMSLTISSGGNSETKAIVLINPDTSRRLSFRGLLVSGIVTLDSPLQHSYTQGASVVVTPTQVVLTSTTVPTSTTVDLDTTSTTTRLARTETENGATANHICFFTLWSKLLWHTALS